MRIGIDMIACQAETGRRGIGRYTFQLVTALLGLDRANDYFLYFRAGLEEPGPLTGAAGRRSYYHVESLYRVNPDALDVLLLSSPFTTIRFADPLPVKHRAGPGLAALIYDLIPLVYPERYLAVGEAYTRLYYNCLPLLRHFDLLLAISQATQSECERLLDLPPQQVVTIGSASDPDFFRPADEAARSAAAGRLPALGVGQPFVFTVAGPDYRKNLEGLLAAYARLPGELRDQYQLVIACRLNEEASRRVYQAVQDQGLAGRLVLTGEVDDVALRILYQNCAAFVFASHHEGFGLPLLEALHCGAAVVAGKNTAQPEVVGDAGLLVNVADPDELASALARVLQDPELNRMLRGRALPQSGRFRWEDTAARASAALSRVAASRAVPAPRLCASRPRLALFAPLPPQTSPVAAFAMRLLAELRHDVAIDLYHAAGYVPQPYYGNLEVGCFDHRLFDRRWVLANYGDTLYLLGDAPEHDFIYQRLLRHPGTVILYEIPQRHFLLGKILEHARQVIVPSPGHFALIQSLDPQRVSRVEVVPADAMGKWVRAWMDRCATVKWTA
jgi:glycosyltransferase involved in cell wall biosynthesis